MKIILIGFMGSGKSSVAFQLGQLLQLPILEMDEVVFQKTNSQNMHEVFDKGGERLLRETEMSIAQECSFIDNHVISTGGGVGLNTVILDALKRPYGKVFFLHAAFQTLKARLANNHSRPLFKNFEEAKVLYDSRYPLYLKNADHVIEVDEKSVEEIAREIRLFV